MTEDELIPKYRAFAIAISECRKLVEVKLPYKMLGSYFFKTFLEQTQAEGYSSELVKFHKHLSTPAVQNGFFFQL